LGVGCHRFERRGTSRGGQGLTPAIRLEGTVEFQQEHGGSLQIHRGYLA
jgi:hypothetical protein